jgi:hypothetical protein
MRKTYITALVSTMVLCLSVNAWANPPFSEISYISDDFPVVSCGDYWVKALANTRVTQTTFFNQDGNPVRLRISMHVTDSVYYNSEDPGIYIQQGAKGTGENVQGKIDLVTGEEQWPGLPFRITLKGIGPLYIEVGRMYWDGESYNFSGMVIFPEAGTGSALCDALAP